MDVKQPPPYHLFQHSSHETKTEIFHSAIAFDLEMQPHLIEGFSMFLEQITSITNNISLITSASKQRAQKMLALHGIEYMFSLIISGDMVEKGKPHPEPYLKAASLLKVSSQECIAFEDSNNGIQSAIDAGMYVIAIQNQSFTHERVINRIDSYSDILTKLE